VLLIWLLYLLRVLLACLLKEQKIVARRISRCCLLVTRFSEHSRNSSKSEYRGILSCKKNPTCCTIFLSIFRQTVRVSGVSRPIIRRYNRMYTTVGTYDFFRWLSVVLVGLDQIQPGQQTVKSVFGILVR